MGKDRIQDLVDVLENNRKSGSITDPKVHFKGYKQDEIDEALRRQGNIISGKKPDAFEDAEKMQSTMRKKYLQAQGYK